MSSPYTSYRDNAVLSATPAKLLTMLYDRLLLDLNRAEEAMTAAAEESDWQKVSSLRNEASTRISHAGEIIAALAGSLRLDIWDGAQGLLSLYHYVAQALVQANLNRAVERVTESIALLEPIRQSWHAAAETVAREHWETGATEDGAAVMEMA